MKYNELLDFIRFVWIVTKGRALWSVFFALVVGLTEGISLVLLIPIVAVASAETSQRSFDFFLIGLKDGLTLPSLGVLLFIFVVIISFQALLSRFYKLFNQHILHDAADKMRNNLFSSVGLAKWEIIKKQRSSDLNHVLIKDTERITAAISGAQSLFQNLVMLIIYFGLAALISWQMALFASLTGTILFLMLFPIRRLATKYGQEMTKFFEGQSRVVLEFLTGLRLVKISVAEKQHVEGYNRHLSDLRKSVFRYLSISSIGTVSFQIGAAIIAAIFVWLSIKVFVLDIARISVLILIFVRLAPKFNVIQDTLQRFLTNIPAFSNYKKILGVFHESQELDPEITLRPPKLSQEIRLDSVGVLFSDSQVPALEDLNVNILAKRVTAIIGPSGSGKSTLADLLIGLTGPTTGQITIDGVVFEETLRRAWRSSVACVSQDAVLMNDTVEANLKVGNQGVTESQIWKALDRAQIGSLIRQLPDGLKTIVQDRGNRFSGGEKQRITLARALLRNPQLLVLDEATSALDWENQIKIAETIKSFKGELTIVTIAHRPSLITFADDVIALENGKIIEQGQFEDLRSNPESVLSKMIKGDQND